MSVDLTTPVPSCLPSTKLTGKAYVKVGVLGVRACTGCLNSENILLKFSLQTKSLGLLHIVLFPPKIIHKSHI